MLKMYSHTILMCLKQNLLNEMKMESKLIVKMMETMMIYRCARPKMLSKLSVALDFHLMESKLDVVIGMVIYVFTIWMIKTLWKSNV